MSDGQKNAYTHQDSLRTNEGATAAAVDILTKAASSEDPKGSSVGLIRCAVQEDFIKELRDKIKAAASE